MSPCGRCGAELVHHKNTMDCISCSGSRDPAPQAPPVPAEGIRQRLIAFPSRHNESGRCWFCDAEHFEDGVTEFSHNAGCLWVAAHGHSQASGLGGEEKLRAQLAELAVQYDAVIEQGCSFKEWSEEWQRREQVAREDKENFRSQLHGAQELLVQFVSAAAAALDEIDLDYHANSKRTPACMRLRKMLNR